MEQAAVVERRRKRKLKMVFLLPVIVVETFGLFCFGGIVLVREL